MKHFIATYDIEAAPGDPHQPFLQAAAGRGWTNLLNVAGTSQELPSGTLIGDFRDIDHANESFEAAISDASKDIAPATITIERRYIVERLPAGRLKARKGQWVRTNIARLNNLLRPKSPG